MSLMASSPPERVAAAAASFERLFLEVEAGGEVVAQDPVGVAAQLLLAVSLEPGEGVHEPLEDVLAAAGGVVDAIHRLLSGPVPARAGGRRRRG